MADFVKATMIFQQPTTPVAGANATPRIAGFSEAWYRAGTIADARANWNRLVDKRAGLMSLQTIIAGYRFQTLTVNALGFIKAGRSLSIGANIASGRKDLADNEDQPDDALRIPLRSDGLSNVRRQWLRGWPDSEITGGEKNLSADTVRRLVDFYTELKAGAWCFAGHDLDATTFAIGDITTLGVVTALETLPGTFVKGRRVQVIRSKQTDGRQRGIITKLLADRVGFGCTLQDWPFGDTKGGYIRVYTPIFPPINLDYDQGEWIIGDRKVGRPSKGYSGRARRRK